MYPAACDNVIAVGGTDHDDKRMNIRELGLRIISNYGFWVDIAAPGAWCYTIMPTYHVTLNDYGMDQNYSFGGCGTSAATPHVAGLAALILSKNPSYSPEKVKSIIRANVDPYDSEVYIGTGRINAYTALIEYNTQPDKPEKPSGETSGKTGREYTYTTSATDPDGDQLYYMWDWGDGNFSELLGPYSSGDTCEASYTWENESDYSISVKATDINGGESEWSDPLLISMPKTYENPLWTLLEKIFEWLEQMLGRNILPRVFNL